MEPVSLHDNRLHSTLEVDIRQEQNVYLLHRKPLTDETSISEQKQAASDNLPESITCSRTSDTERRNRVCGISRRSFWVILGIAIGLVITGAVGGGVGGAISASKSRSVPKIDDQSPFFERILENSHLASINFTDADRVNHFRVFFQANSSAIYQSAWNDSGRVWTVLPVTRRGSVDGIDTEIEVKDNTPIAANVNFFNGVVGIQLYFLNPQNILQQLYTNSPQDYSTRWKIGSLKDQYVAGSKSNLASYGLSCSDCLDSTFVIYQDPKSILKMLLINDNNVTLSQVFSAPVTNGSYLSLVPVRYGEGGVVKLYYNDDNKILGRNWNGSGWSPQNDLADAKQLFSPRFAALSILRDLKDSQKARYVNILWTNSSGGINVGLWQSQKPGIGFAFDYEQQAFSQVVSDSNIATNMAGKVYSFAENKNNSYELQEWENTAGSTYKSVGKVETTMT